MFPKAIRFLFGSLRFFMIIDITLIYIFLIPKNDITWATYAGPIIAWIFSEMNRKTE